MRAPRDPAPRIRHRQADAPGRGDSNHGKEAEMPTASNTHEFIVQTGIPFPAGMPGLWAVVRMEDEGASAVWRQVADDRDRPEYDPDDAPGLWIPGGLALPVHQGLPPSAYPGSRYWLVDGNWCEEDNLDRCVRGRLWPDARTSCHPGFSLCA